MICRTIERGRTFSVAVSREMLDFIARLREPHFSAFMGAWRR
jgi:hypothetical protein